jgi:hypothetical protein
MAHGASCRAIGLNRERHVACLFDCSEAVMSQRAHFWLRIAGLAVILAAEFAPRLWTAGPQAAQTSMASAADGR